MLRVLALLVERPGGVRADEVAAALGKSTSTAYYLLTSLCEEGFAVHESKGLYRPARGLEELTAVAEESGQLGDGLSGTVDELFLRTRKRSYLGVVRAGRIEITTFRGRQGVPRIPGLGNEIRDSAHALAMGKVVLALLDANGVSRYVARGLSSFTSQTITSPRSWSPNSSASGPMASRSTARSSIPTSAASRRRSSTSAAASPRCSGCRSPPTCSTPSTSGSPRSWSTWPKEPPSRPPRARATAPSRNGAARAAAARKSASHAGRSRISTVSRVAS